MQRSNLSSPIWDNNNNQLPPVTPSGQEKTPPPPPAAPLAPQDLWASSPSHARSKVEKEEGPPPLVTSPVASLGGPANSGVSATHSHPTPSGGGRKQDLRLPKRRPPGRRYQCSGDGCRLACRSMKELLDHIRVHYRPTQSVEGKIFRCSSPGCLESFPNMQVLMEHIKVHYKPNRYFKCENCMTRFRTYRSLFKHLHSCSSARTAAGAAAAADTPPLPPEKPLPEKEPPGKLLEVLPKLQTVIQQLRKEAILPGEMEAPVAAPDPLPAGPLGPLPALPPGSHAFPLLEPSLFGPPPPLARFPGPAPHTLPGPFLPYVHPGSYALPPAAVQSRLRPFLPAQGLPISNAVWKKSQGHSSNSRIVWEHTRGRYNCLQCSYSTASREEVTQHVEDHRKNPSPPGRLDGEMDFGVGLPSFHPRLTPEVENTLFSPL
ncbi:zinc finger protein 414 isoform X1 [Podarcis raffonei]|uniref:zinc finger protein 414 isoform X1 n=1 Tax=Podarcis raffonei TaxID=65483 RepID=UPI0023292F58|nr:zinc finger protein 414 isoform X1 [Podarcis raffonei]